MARWRIGDALYALSRNQLDRRENGVFDYSQSQYADDEGPGAVTVGSSGSAIVVDVTAFSGQIEGVEVDFGTQSATLDPNGDPANERIDVIAGTPSGNVEAWKGQLAPTTTTENDDGDSITLTGRQNPRSEPPDLRDLEGVVLAAVRVPPGASNTSDLTQDDIHDLRRPALDVTGERNLQVLGLPYSSLEGGGGEHSRVGQSIIIPPDTTLSVHSWGLCWKDEWGSSGPAGGHSLRVLDENHEQLESTTDLWESGEDGDPLFSFSNDGDVPIAYQVQLLNNSDEDFSWNNNQRGMSANVYYQLI